MFCREQRRVDRRIQGFSCRFGLTISRDCDDNPDGVHLAPASDPMMSRSQTPICLVLIAVLLCTGVTDAGLWTSCCCDRQTDGERATGQLSSCCHAPQATATHPTCCKSTRCATEGMQSSGRIQLGCQCECVHDSEPFCSARVQLDGPEVGAAMVSHGHAAGWQCTVATLAIDHIVVPTVSAQRLLCVWRL